MTLQRAFVPLLLTLVLALPASSATLLQPVEHPEALDAWGLTPRSADLLSPSVSTDLALDVQRQALTLAAAGDVDTDGVDDVVLQSVDLQSGFTKVEAISGTALEATGFTEEIWTLTPNQGSVFHVVGDIDGDAVADFVVSQSIGAGTAQAQAVGEASAGTADASGTALFQVIDGASAAGSFGVQMATSIESQAAGAAEAGVERIVETAGTVQATGTGALHQVQSEVETTKALLLDQLPIDVLANVEADAVITVLDATGSVRGQITLDDPASNPLLVAAPDLDADGIADTVLMEVQKASPAEQASAIVPTISSYVGASVSQDWSIDMDPLAGIPLLVPDVGDLNGDGITELAYHGISQVPGSAPTGTALSIINGATGEILAQKEVAEGLLIAAPLGGSIGVDTDSEVLLLSGTAQAITEVAVAGQGLDEVWSMTIPKDAAPINLVTDAFTGATEGLTDLTGDGVPDLALASGFVSDPLSGDVSVASSAGDLVLEVYSGVDGTLAWSKNLDPALAVQTIEGLAGAAGDGLAIIEAQGGKALDNGLQQVQGVSLLLLQASDGAGILRLPLVEGEVIAALGDAVAVTADVEAAGDVDADGVTDLLVRVEAVLDDAPDVDVAQIQGQAVAATEMALDQVYVVSGKTGEILQTTMETSEAAKASVGGSAQASAEGSANVSLDAPLPSGDVEELEAYGVDSADGGQVEAPGLGVLPLIGAAAVLVALLRRRD